MTLDLSYMNAAQLVLPESDSIRLILAGCGGTGSAVARHVAQVGRILKDKGAATEVLFVDPDIVEAKNIPRQGFCDAELGQSKAVALARRYAAAWGLEIVALKEKINSEHIVSGNSLNIVIGCVDNAEARRVIASAIKTVWRETQNYWWLDLGNGRDTGQAMLGSTHQWNAKTAFPVPSICTAIPLPSLQAPDLLEDQPEPDMFIGMSCAELSNLELQGLTVNSRVAAEAGDYLYRMLITRDLKKYSTYFDLPSGTARSEYLTPESLSRHVAPKADRKKTKSKR